MINNVKNRFDVQKINDLMLSSPLELVDVAEERYFDQLNRIAKKTSEKRESSHIILIAGPSGSTKTTTANKLSETLLKTGINSVVISLDDFFKDRDDLPRLENGDRDYETINTLDMKTLKRCLDELLVNNHSEFPIFDFTIGRRSDKKRDIALNNDTVVIIEGIHALNPVVLEGHDKNSFIKLYVSPHSEFYLGDEVVLTSRNLRLIRRLIRDFFYRNNSLDSTMDMWTNVVKSEIVNVIPYKSEADFMIDSTIMYEPGVYEYYLREIIKENELSGIYKETADGLLNSLEKFNELPLDIIPDNTVLWEFLKR